MPTKRAVRPPLRTREKPRTAPRRSPTAWGPVLRGLARCQSWRHRFVFFFKQKTAYEISECDRSSDVCSSDLLIVRSVEICWGVNTKLIDKFYDRYFRFC